MARTVRPGPRGAPRGQVARQGGSAQPVDLLNAARVPRTLAAQMGRRRGVPVPRPQRPRALVLRLSAEVSPGEPAAVELAGVGRLQRRTASGMATALPGAEVAVVAAHWQSTALPQLP
jgi:hypothetical protein